MRVPSPAARIIAQSNFAILSSYALLLVVTNLPEVTDFYFLLLLLWLYRLGSLPTADDKQIAQSADCAIISSPTWIRTKTKGSKDPCAAITPWGNK